MVVSGWTVKRRATRKRLPWLWLDSSYTRPKPFVFHCFFLCVWSLFFFCKELQCSKRFKEIDFVTRWYFVCCVLFQTEFCSIWMSPSFCSPSTWYWLEGLWFWIFLKVRDLCTFSWSSYDILFCLLIRVTITLLFSMFTSLSSFWTLQKVICDHFLRAQDSAINFVTRINRSWTTLFPRLKYLLRNLLNVWMENSDRIRICCLDIILSCMSFQRYTWNFCKGQWNVAKRSYLCICLFIF